jgi:hypothetical protein
MDREQEISEVVDEFADELDPIRIRSEAERLGITAESLLDRIVTETKTRIGDE